MQGLRYLSVCSGIEAASVAWHPLGWSPAGFAEIEAFPSAVLAHHYGSNLPGEPLTSNGVPNFGNMERFGDWPTTDVDVLVGGTPCQSFSVAGLRKGLADPRGNLCLTFLAIADKYRPAWVLWENVPGVLSSNGGRDFGAFLGGLGQLGYGWAYRVLDAQYVRVDGFARAVPQRRRRVFVVGHLGDWRRAAAVLFESESLSGHPAPRRQAGKGFAQDVVSSLVSSGRGIERTGETRGQDHVIAVAFGGNNTEGPIEVATACNAHGGPMGRMDFESETFVAHSLRADGFDESEDGTGRGTPLVAVPHASVAFTQNSRSELRLIGEDGSVVGAVTSEPGAQCQSYVAFDMRGREGGSQFEGPHDTANIRAASGGSSRSYVAETWAVRRLTPLECERLQGFPDGYTAIPFRGKLAADGPRYKALGNSMAVNAMRWIGTRIQMIHAMEASDA